MTDVHTHNNHTRHDHHHDDDHEHDHHHDDNHSHDHDHDSGLWGMIAAALHLPGYSHSHDHSYASLAGDAALRDNELGIRTVKWALLALGVTTVFQVFIYVASGSVALLADTVHNLGDALNSIPLWMAFVLARRRPNKRYTYGYGRAEDVAGLLIVVSIGFSAAYILWESVQKFINPKPMDNLVWVALAAVVGFIGNEIVALLQIRVGRKIGSEAMVADGLHARTDGLTSLAVLIAVIGTILGAPILDPIIGFLIGITILFITRDAIRAMWYRLMDAVDPALIETAESIIHKHPEVQAIQRLQMRWLGHRLYAEAVLGLAPNLTMIESEHIADHISHHLYHAFPNLSEATIAVVPWNSANHAFQQESEHHRPSQIEAASS